MFGSLENKFVISFRTEMDGTILYSGHNSYRDFFKLEVLGGKLRFSVDAGEEVISVISSDIVTDGNTTSAIAVYVYKVVCVGYFLAPPVCLTMCMSLSVSVIVCVSVSFSLSVCYFVFVYFLQIMEKFFQGLLAMG